MGTQFPAPPKGSGGPSPAPGLYLKVTVACRVIHDEVSPALPLYDLQDQSTASHQDSSP